jgi:hypothetical protein
MDAIVAWNGSSMRVTSNWAHLYNVDSLTKNNTGQSILILVVEIMETFFAQK